MRHETHCVALCLNRFHAYEALSSTSFYSGEDHKRHVEEATMDVKFQQHVNINFHNLVIIEMLFHRLDTVARQTHRQRDSFQ